MPDETAQPDEWEVEGHCRRCGVRDPMDDNGTSCCEYGHDWTTDEAAQPDPFTEEDRARVGDYTDRVEAVLVRGALLHPAPNDRDLLRRAASHIDHLEAALREADELARVYAEELDREAEHPGSGNWPKVGTACNLYRSARAASASHKEGEK